MCVRWIWRLFSSLKKINKLFWRQKLVTQNVSLVTWFLDYLGHFITKISTKSCHGKEHLCVFCMVSYCHSSALLILFPLSLLGETLLFIIYDTFFLSNWLLLFGSYFVGLQVENSSFKNTLNALKTRSVCVSVQILCFLIKYGNFQSVLGDYF